MLEYVSKYKDHVFICCRKKYLRMTVHPRPNLAFIEYGILYLVEPMINTLPKTTT